MEKLKVILMESSLVRLLGCLMAKQTALRKVMSLAQLTENDSVMLMVILKVMRLVRSTGGQMVMWMALTSEMSLVC